MGQRPISYQPGASPQVTNPITFQGLKARLINPHATRFVIHILVAVAEHERNMISTRTKDALAAAKRRTIGIVNGEWLTDGHSKLIARYISQTTSL
jgi:hypothetical protein